MGRRGGWRKLYRTSEVRLGRLISGELLADRAKGKMSGRHPGRGHDSGFEGVSGRGEPAPGPKGATEVVLDRGIAGICRHGGSQAGLGKAKPSSSQMGQSRLVLVFGTHRRAI